MFVLLKGKNVQPDSPKETMEGEVRDEDVEQVEEETYMLSVYWHERVLGAEVGVIEFLTNCVEQPLLAPVDDEDE